MILTKRFSSAYGVLYDEFVGFKGVSKRSAFVVDKEEKSLILGLPTTLNNCLVLMRLKVLSIYIVCL